MTAYIMNTYTRGHILVCSCMHMPLLAGFVHKNKTARFGKNDGLTAYKHEHPRSSAFSACGVGVCVRQMWPDRTDLKSLVKTKPKAYEITNQSKKTPTYSKKTHLGGRKNIFRAM